MENLSYEDRICILKAYQKSATEIFEKYKYLLTNPELKLCFELGDPHIHASIIDRGQLGGNLAICAIHCGGCIILMLDVILESALLIVDEYADFIKSGKDRLMIIWHVLEHTILHEMRHASQPFNLVNSAYTVIPSIEYIRRETDADYIANKILIEDFGAPEWLIGAINLHGYALPMQLVYDQSRLNDVGLYYYEFIKTLYFLGIGRFENDILGTIQSAIFDLDNVYLYNNINGRNTVVCLKHDGKFYPPSEEFCRLYDIAFLGINEQSFSDKPYMISIYAESIEDNGILFVVEGERLIPAFTTNLGCYYNT